MAIQFSLLPRYYSCFGIGVDRWHTLKWLFHQGKAALHYAKSGNVYSETALARAYFFCGACFFAARVAGKYPVRVRTDSLPMPGASAVTCTRRNPGSVDAFEE